MLNKTRHVGMTVWVTRQQKYQNKNTFMPSWAHIIPTYSLLTCTVIGLGSTVADLGGGSRGAKEPPFEANNKKS